MVRLHPASLAAVGAVSQMTRLFSVEGGGGQDERRVHVEAPQLLSESASGRRSEEASSEQLR